MNSNYSKEQIYDNVIIGGGISGIAALFYLIKSGKKNVLLLEKDSSLGGMVKSHSEDNFLVEKGPHAFLKSYKYTEQFIDDLGLASSVINNQSGANNRYIVRDNDLHKLPDNPLAFFSSKLLSNKAKLRVICEPFIARGKMVEESVYQFGKRRFGSEVAEIIFDSLVSGISAGDSRKVDIHSLFPKLSKIEKDFRSLILFLIKFQKDNLINHKINQKGDQNKKKQAKVLFKTLKNGMGEIASIFEKNFREYINLNAKVSSLKKNQNTNCFEISINQGAKRIFSKNIIFATQAMHAAELLKEDRFKKLSSLLCSISYPDVVTVHLGFKKGVIKGSIDGFGCLIPRGQKFRTLGVLYSSELFPGRAPDGFQMIKIYLGGATDSEIVKLSDEEIFILLKKEVYQLLKIEQQEMPVFTLVDRISQAIPQYNLGHRAIKEAIEIESQNFSDIVLLGNYFDGVSVNEAIKRAKEKMQIEREQERSV